MKGGELEGAEKGRLERIFGGSRVVHPLFALRGGRISSTRSRGPTVKFDPRVWTLAYDGQGAQIGRGAGTGHHAGGARVRRGGFGATTAVTLVCRL